MLSFIYDVAVRLQIIRWKKEEDATALTETVILFPVLITLLMGCYDLGRGVNINHKVIGAAQMIGDLITRDRSVTKDSLEDLIVAGELALEPFSKTPFGYDIVSVQFDTNGNPVVLWRVTENMNKNDDAVASTKGLGTSGEGVVVVTSSYKYKPYFAEFIVDEINMKEVAFLRGRKSSTIVCADCPT